MLGPSASASASLSALSFFEPLPALASFLASFFGSLAFAACLSGALGGATAGAADASGAAGATSVSAAIAPVSIQAAVAFLALALEDEADQAAAVEVADRVEGDRAVPAAVDAHDPAGAADHEHAGCERQLELDLVADPQRVGAREQEPAAADVDGEALDGDLVGPAVHEHGAGGLDANVFALLQNLDRARRVDAHDVGVGGVGDDRLPAQAH